MNDAEHPPLGLNDLRQCFEGVVPAVIVTASAQGIPNVTYLSRVRQVDDERIALSNQFFSKTMRNLAENPRANLLLVDPTTYDEYRVTVVYERTERRGPLFDKLRADVEAVALLSGMQDVFKLRAADVYRVVHLEHLHPHRHGRNEPMVVPVSSATAKPTRLAELTNRLSRCPDLDTLVSATVDGLAELLDYEHSVLFLLDETERQLFTIASHGFDREGVGSEVALGEGIAGLAAARCSIVRVGSLRQMAKYSRTVQRAYGEQEVGPGWEIAVPEVPLVQSRVAVPAMALGQLVGVLMVESTEVVAFDEEDEAALSVVAAVVANAIEIGRAQERSEEAREPRPSISPAPRTSPAGALVRFFGQDGSVFLDGDYLIKGVAGRILWSLLGCYQRDGRVEFTNKEVRLDPSLGLPEFRDNLESRLILLKRRLEEREAPIQIEKTGRGRFRLVVGATLELEDVDDPSES